MNVRMVMQVLAPAVQYDDEADLGTQVPRIGFDLAQGFGRRPEQNGIDPRLVLEGDFGDRRRHGEDDVEIGRRQQLGLPLNQPCGPRRPLAFRAMPVAARIVGDADQATLRAALDMTAERCRAAGLYRPHDAALGSAEVAGLRLAERLTVAAEDIRNLQRGHDQPGFR